jgi:hypothetical protein
MSIFKRGAMSRVGIFVGGDQNERQDAKTRRKKRKAQRFLFFLRVLAFDLLTSRKDRSALA